MAVLPLGSIPEATILDSSIALGWQLLRRVEAFALQFSDLGAIDLPPLQDSELDRTNLRTVAPLYLAAELEAARLLPAVDLLVGLLVSGGLPADLGAGSAIVTQFWQTRNQRFTRAERQAIFARLFGSNGATLSVSGGRNTAFEPLLIDLAEALYKVEQATLIGSRASEMPIRIAARRLANNLLSRSGGIAGFAAQELLRSIEQAIAILKQPAVQQAVGGRSVWLALGSITERYLNESIDIAAHVDRGRMGMQLLAWLAEALPNLENDAVPIVSPDHPVITAAASWLQSSLSLVDAPALPGGG